MLHTKTRNATQEVRCVNARLRKMAPLAVLHHLLYNYIWLIFRVRDYVIEYGSIIIIWLASKITINQLLFIVYSVTPLLCKAAIYLFRGRLMIVMHSPAVRLETNVIYIYAILTYRRNIY